jgi:hypothetical protein
MSKSNSRILSPSSVTGNISMLTVANDPESIHVFTHVHYLQVWKRNVEILIHISKPYQSHICDDECAKISLLNQNSNYM